MSKGILAIAKLNLRNIESAYFSAAITAFIMFALVMIIYIITVSSGNVQNSSISGPGNAIYLILIIAAITIPTGNFRRVINLGGRRENFFWGTLAAYAILTVAASLANNIVFYTFDTFMQNSGYFGTGGGSTNIMQAFGWTQNGFVIAFFQQAAFMFLLSIFIHTFVSVQGKLLGWTVNFIFVAVLAVFISIATLRQTLVQFFNLIIFHDTAMVQIVVCIVLALAIYMLNKPIYVRKAI